MKTNNAIAICAGIMLSLSAAGCTTLPSGQSNDHGDRLLLSAEDTGTAIALFCEMAPDFDGRFVVEILDASSGELVTSRNFRPRGDGMLILQIPRDDTGREVRMATRFVAPDGTIASRQPFDRTFSAELGTVYTTDYVLYIHSYGGTELRSFDRTIGTDLPEQLSEQVLALDSDFQYFSFIQRQVVGMDNAGSVPTRTVKVSVSVRPGRRDGETGLPTEIAFEDLNEYLSHVSDEKTLELVESLYRVVGARAIATREISSLPYNDRVRLADWYLPQRDQDNSQYHLIWYQVPLILNEEMYETIARMVTTDEEKSALERYEAYGLPDRTIYLYNGERFPPVFSYDDTVQSYYNYTQEEKAILADLFFMLPEKYTGTGASFGMVASGFSRYPEEDPDGSSNRLYAGILASLQKAGVSQRAFFSYYTAVEHVVVQEYRGNTYRRPCTTYVLDRNWYRLSPEDLEILSAWKDR